MRVNVVGLKAAPRLSRLSVLKAEGAHVGAQEEEASVAAVTPSWTSPAEPEEANQMRFRS